MELTQERLRQLVRYDPLTGAFVRLQAGGKRATRPDRIGSPAGSVGSNGYLYLSVAGKRYSAHRLAWFYSYGAWPSQVDHLNRDRADNRLANLREVSTTENNRNTAARGYWWHPGARKWRAGITVDGRNVHLGYFADEADARAAYLEAKAELHAIPAGSG